jgi:hypothetical protein
MRFSNLVLYYGVILLINATIGSAALIAADTDIDSSSSSTALSDGSYDSATTKIVMTSSGKIVFLKQQQ